MAKVKVITETTNRWNKLVDEMCNVRGIKIKDISSQVKGLEGTKISNIRSSANQNNITLETLENFLTAFPEVSAEWLLRGKGSMFIEAKEALPDESHNEIIDVVDKRVLDSVIEAYEDTIKKLGDKINEMNNIMAKIREIQLNKAM